MAQNKSNYKATINQHMSDTLCHQIKIEML